MDSKPSRIPDIVEKKESDLTEPSVKTTIQVCKTNGVIGEIQLASMTTKEGCETDEESLSMVEEHQRKDLRQNLIDRLARSDAHFKDQQRGLHVPDLTHEEKSQIASDILLHNPVTFLYRFGKFLAEEDLEYFKHLNPTYEIKFYLTQILERLNPKKNKITVKNRRFEAMKKLMEAGEYFSDEQMKWRDPYLYEQMIGQYLTHDERQSEIDKSDLRFSTILLKHLTQQQENCLYYTQKDNEECQEEEEEDSDSEEDVEMLTDNMSEDKASEDSVPVISPEERCLLREEFLHIMQERFISGKDIEFDYSTVDENLEYDSLKIRAQDEEEKYFDEDESDGEQDIVQDDVVSDY